MRSALKVLFVPIMLLGFNGAAVWIVTAHLSLYWLAPLLVAAIVFATAVERIIPYHAAWNEEPGELRRDLIHALVNVAIIIFLVLVIPSRAYALAAALADLGAVPAVGSGRRRRAHPRARSEPPGDLALAHPRRTPCRDAHVRFQRPLAAPRAPGVRDHRRGRRADRARHAPRDRSSGRLRGGHPVCAAAFERRHAYRPLRLAARGRARAPSPSPPDDHIVRRQFRPLHQPLGSPSGHGRCRPDARRSARTRLASPDPDYPTAYLAQLKKPFVPRAPDARARQRGRPLTADRAKRWRR